MFVSLPKRPLKCLAPPPKGPNGEPVIVRPKIGFTNLNNIDTVGQTVFVRFFLDLYWVDARMVGAQYVPENLWRPAECYIINQVEDMSVVAHADQPILVDANKVRTRLPGSGASPHAAAYAALPNYAGSAALAHRVLRLCGQPDGSRA